MGLDPQTSFRKCRTLGHAWDGSLGKAGPGLLHLHCKRCNTTRDDAFSTATGIIVKRRYVYPEGYRFPKGSLVPTRAAFRLLLVEELVVAATTKKKG